MYYIYKYSENITAVIVVVLLAICSKEQEAIKKKETKDNCSRIF